MIKTFLSALALMFFAQVAAADTGLRYTPLGYQQITSLSAAQSLTVPTGATMAMITAEAQAVRFRDDGTSPTATVGLPLAVGLLPFQYSGNLSAIKFIEQTASAKLNVVYYR